MTEAVETLNKAVERLAREQEILGKEITKNRKAIIQLALQQEPLVATVGQIQQQQEQLIATVSALSQAMATVKTQIQEIKRGIFLTGLEHLRDYYVTSDPIYLDMAINSFTTARNVKNPKLEPLIDFYLINARAEKYRVKNLKGELTLLKENLTELARLTDRNNYTLLLTAYKMLGDIPVDGKFEIVKTAVGKVVEDLIKDRKFEDALEVAKAYQVFTGDSSLKQQVMVARLDNFNRFKNIKDPRKILEVLENNQNSLLVKHYARWLYENGYYREVVQVLNRYPLDDEKFEYSLYYLSFLQLGEENKAQKLFKLVLENPTYRGETKKTLKTLDVNWRGTIETFKGETDLMF